MRKNIKFTMCSLFFATTMASLVGCGNVGVDETVGLDIATTEEMRVDDESIVNETDDSVVSQSVFEQANGMKADTSSKKQKEETTTEDSGGLKLGVQGELANETETTTESPETNAKYLSKEYFKINNVEAIGNPVSALGIDTSNAVESGDGFVITIDGAEITTKVVAANDAATTESEETTEETTEEKKVEVGDTYVTKIVVTDGSTDISGVKIGSTKSNVDTLLGEATSTKDDKLTFNLSGSSSHIDITITDGIVTNIEMDIEL